MLSTAYEQFCTEEQKAGSLVAQGNAEQETPFMRFLQLSSYLRPDQVPQLTQLMAPSRGLFEQAIATSVAELLTEGNVLLIDAPVSVCNILARKDYSDHDPLGKVWDSITETTVKLYAGT